MPKRKEDEAVTKLREFLSHASKRFRACQSAEAKWREAALDDWQFRIGKQWPDRIEDDRTMDGRPCLVMNRIPGVIRRLTNEQRQQNSDVLVEPIGSGSDLETAEIFNGIVRHISNNSDAEVADDTAFDAAVTGGFGCERITVEYVDDLGFDQEIVIKRIKNPFTVYTDPGCQEPDTSDARFKFVVEDLSKEEYKIRYPDTQMATLTNFKGVGDEFPGWASEEKIRIAEYWHVEEEPTEIYELKDGTVSEKKPNYEARSRTVKRKTVYLSVINAVEVLEPRDAKEQDHWGQIWPGYCIPLIPFYGEDLDVNGERYIAGIVRDAKDPQRMYNYWNSAATETIALAPRAPFIGAVGQFENQEAKWRQANTRNQAYLEYNTVDVAGRPAPPPQRNSVEPPIQAMAQMLKQADYDLQATTSTFDPSLGKQTTQAESGKAILALQRQGDVATYNFGDNAARAIRFRGRILVDLIPKIYDAPRVQRIVKPDGTSTHVVVHNSKISKLSNEEALAQAGADQGLERVYDLSVGRYNVVVETGPSHQTKRQEAVASIMALVQAFPQVMAVCGDLLVGDMDWPQAQQIALRLKKMLPAQLQDDDNSDPQTVNIKLQGQVQQMSQTIDQLTQHLQAAVQQIEQKTVEQQGKMEIVKLQENTKIVVAELQAKVQEAQKQADRELARLELAAGHAHEVAMQATAPPPTNGANGAQPSGGANG